MRKRIVSVSITPGIGNRILSLLLTLLRLILGAFVAFIGLIVLVAGGSLGLLEGSQPFFLLLLCCSMGIMVLAYFIVNPGYLQRQTHKRKTIYRRLFLIAGASYVPVAVGGLFVMAQINEECSGAHGCDMGGGIFAFFGLLAAIAASAAAVSWWMLACNLQRQLHRETQDVPEANTLE